MRQSRTRHRSKNANDVRKAERDQQRQQPRGLRRPHPRQSRVRAIECHRQVRYRMDGEKSEGVQPLEPSAERQDRQIAGMVEIFLSAIRYWTGKLRTPSRGPCRRCANTATRIQTGKTRRQTRSGWPRATRAIPSRTVCRDPWPALRRAFAYHVVLKTDHSKSGASKRRKRHTGLQKSGMGDQ